MQRMHPKHDDHFWCKVKTTNIKNVFNIRMLIEMEYQSPNSNSSRGYFETLDY
jgi:hypothetical protein